MKLEHIWFKQFEYLCTYLSFVLLWPVKLKDLSSYVDYVMKECLFFVWLVMKLNAMAYFLLFRVLASIYGLFNVCSFCHFSNFFSRYYRGLLIRLDCRHPAQFFYALVPFFCAAQYCIDVPLHISTYFCTISRNCSGTHAVFV